MIAAIETAARWHYAAVLAASLLITLPLEFVLGARVYRRPKRLALTILSAATPFVLWDVAAIRAGHWSISDEFTTGLDIAIMPIEEVSFFVVIPICAILTYEVIRRLPSRREDNR